MDPDAPQNLTGHAARRRRVLAGVLAGAAIAIPGVAFAAGDAPSGASAVDPAAETPALTVQDDGSAARDGRPPCPEDQDPGDGAVEGSGDGAPQAPSAQETAL